MIPQSILFLRCLNLPALAPPTSTRYLITRTDFISKDLKYWPPVKTVPPPHIHRLMNGKTRCEIYIQWTIIRFSKREHSDICYNMDFEHIMLNKPDSKGQSVWLHLWGTFNNQTSQSESSMVDARGWRDRGEESLFNGCRVSVWGNEKVLEMGGGEDGWLQNNMYALNATETYT